MEKEQLYELIEQYLDGTLSVEALATFEKRLQTEPELAKEVTLHRKLQEELGNAQKRQLRSKLDVLRKEFTPSENETKIVSINQTRRLRLLISVAASILVLVFAIWFFFFKTPEKQEIVDEKPPMEKESLDPNEKPIKEIEDPSNLVEDQTDPEKQPTEKDEIEDIVPPINLIAAFEANPELENLIAQNGNNEAFEFSAEKPELGEVFNLKNGKIDLQINGMLFTSELKDLSSFEVAIYNNNPQNFASKKNIATIQLILEKDTSEEEDGLAFATKDGYFYSLKKSLSAKPGLYYYLILQKGQPKPLFIGKFQVNE